MKIISILSLALLVSTSASFAGPVEDAKAKCDTTIAAMTDAKVKADTEAAVVAAVAAAKDDAAKIAAYTTCGKPAEKKEEVKK